MATVTFDTLKFVDRLEKAGLSRDQASAIVEAQAESLAQALDTTLATKADIAGVQVDLRELEMRVIKWMVGLALAQVGLLVGILVKLL